MALASRPSRGGVASRSASSQGARPAQPRRAARVARRAKRNGNSNDADAAWHARREQLQTVLAGIEKEYGKGIVTVLGEDALQAKVDTIPTGVHTLDLALGGGIPKGRIIEVYGPESSGKTTLAMHAIAEVQRLGGTAVLVDAEHAFDPVYSRKVGVDVEKLIIVQAEAAEEALECVDRFARSNAVDIICIDSVAALVPKAEIEGEMGTPQIGLQARLMSQALRRLNANASKCECTVVFLNQLRHKGTHCVASHPHPHAHRETDRPPHLLQWA